VSHGLYVSDTVSIAELRKLQRKPAKYRNRKHLVENIKFDSIAEARRYIDLRLLEKGGKITDLTLQPVYDLHVCGVLVCRYKADFRYLESGAVVVEDVKGVRTPTYRLKKKLMKAIHGIDIREVDQ
jgi:hypothetical protein